MKNVARLFRLKIVEFVLLQKLKDQMDDNFSTE